MTIQPDLMLKIDRTKPLAKQPGLGHNRWHPDIPARVRVDPGQVVGIETIDAVDGQTTPAGNKCQPEAVHILTGPIAINGAQPGDLLEIEILDIVPEPTGFTTHGSRYGFLLSDFPNSELIAFWNIANGFATSPQLPGIRIPECSHIGVMGVAPSHELLRQINEREKQWSAQGATVHPPTLTAAVPADERIAREALRTISPHENGGNLDIKQLGKGATLRLPVFVKDALFSAGDVHFAQGDGEVCGTAIEIAATVYLKFGLIKGAGKNIRDPQLFRAFGPQPARRYFATTGQSHSQNGHSRAEDINAATRNALVNMIDWLVTERRLTRQQAYILCSVAVDLKIAQLVDNPNYLVTAFIPLDIFL